MERLANRRQLLSKVLQATRTADMAEGSHLMSLGGSAGPQHTYTFLVMLMTKVTVTEGQREE